MKLKEDVRGGIFFSKSKLRGEVATGYAQTMLRSGGRSGIGFALGVRWKI